MKASAAVVAVLVWSLLLGCAAFAFGFHVRDGKQATKEVQSLRTAVTSKARQDRKSLAAGVRTEQAATGADQAFQTIRSDYEADLRKNPDAGCVLDADSLRRWNAANAESERDAAGEPAAAVPGAAEGEARAERGDQPH
jgi:hypothetical protein